MTIYSLIYAGYIMRNAGLDEAQAGIKIGGRNINNLRYADDTTLMAESEEEAPSEVLCGHWHKSNEPRVSCCILSKTSRDLLYRILRPDTLP